MRVVLPSRWVRLSDTHRLGFCFGDFVPVRRHTSRLRCSTVRAMSERCPACTGPGRPLNLVVESRYRLLRCTMCGTQFFRRECGAPGEASTVRDESEYWEAYKFGIYNDPAVREGFARRYADVLELAERTVGPVRSIIDIGCGTGNFLDFAARRGLRAVGVDLDDDAVSGARARGLDAYTASELDEVASAAIPTQFDALSMWDVVEHLIDPASTLRSLFPRVREGGMLLFETPDGGFSVRRAVLGLHRFSAARIDLTRSMFYWEHRIYFTERGFRQLMQRLGCEVVAVQRTTSVRETMSAVFAAEAAQGGRLDQRVLSKVWPALEGFSRTVGLGNRLIIVARRGSRTPPEGSPAS